MKRADQDLMNAAERLGMAIVQLTELSMFLRGTSQQKSDARRLLAKLVEVTEPVLDAAGKEAQ